MSSTTRYATLPYIDALLDPPNQPMWDRLTKLPEELRAARLEDSVVLLRYADAKAVLANRNVEQGILDDLGRSRVDPRYLARRRRSILHLSGEEHARQRRQAGSVITPRMIEDLRPKMRQVVNGLLDAIAPQTSCEAVAQLTQPYPISIICSVLGIPASAGDSFSHAIEEATLALFDPEANSGGLHAHNRIDAYIAQLLDHSSYEPGENLCAHLAGLAGTDEAMTAEEISILVSTMFGAGTDTTRVQLASILEFLARHPEHWAMLRRHPEAIPAVAEEIIRLRPVVSFLRRTVLGDIELDGLALSAGTRVILAVSAINRDLAIHHDPHAFNPSRQTTATHLAFGGGPHFCLGTQLGRAEIHEALAVLTRRLETVSLDGEPTWRPPKSFQGPALLPLRFTPAAISKEAGP